MTDPTPRPQRLALTACMFLITATTGFLQPFVTLYLAASGLRTGQIGLVVGLGQGLAWLVQPALGWLSDRLDARRPLMVGAALVAAGAYFAYAAAPQGSVAAFLLLTFLGVNGTTYLNAVGGVLVGRLRYGATGGGAAYAGYRVWGSVGYIVVALTAGTLVGRHLARPGLTRQDLTPVFTHGPWLFVAIALASLFVPDRKNAAPPPRHVAAAPLSANLRWFLAAFFLYQFSLYGASAYISLYLKALGATPLWITATFATGVVCEVLVMTRIGRWSDTYGRRPALAVAFLMLPVRLLAYVPARTPLEVLLVQSLHGFNFGIMGAIAVVFVNDLAADHGRGTAQARLAAVQGLATALGPAACGALAQRFGIGGMFAAMAAVGAAGAAVFLTQVRESHPAPESLLARCPACFHPVLRLLAAPPSARSRVEQP